MKCPHCKKEITTAYAEGKFAQCCDIDKEGKIKTYDEPDLEIKVYTCPECEKDISTKVYE